MNGMNNTFVKGLTRRGMMLGGVGFAGLAATMIFAERSPVNAQTTSFGHCCFVSKMVGL